MKRMVLFTACCAIVIAGSLFLPYEAHTPGARAFFQNAMHQEQNPIYGYQLSQLLHMPIAHIPWSAIAIMALLIRFRPNLLTAILAVMTGVVSCFVMGILSFLLTYRANFVFPSEKRFELQYGYFIALAVIAIWLAGTIVHLVKTAQKIQRS